MENKSSVGNPAPKVMQPVSSNTSGPTPAKSGSGYVNLFGTQLKKTYLYVLVALVVLVVAYFLYKKLYGDSKKGKKRSKESDQDDEEEVEVEEDSEEEE